MQRIREIMDNKMRVFDEIHLLMIRKQTTEGVQTQRKNQSRNRTDAGRSNLRDKGEALDMRREKKKQNTSTP